MKKFFIDLQNGDVGLAKTFWLFVVLSNAIMTIPVVILRDIAMKTGSITLFFYMLCVCAAWKSFTLISGWKASSKYTGKYVWVVLARVALIIFWVGVFSDVNSIFALKDHV